MEKQFKTNGVNFRYTIDGEGVAVVLMHGWGCEAATLQSIKQQLVPFFKVINVNFPGFGGSSEPTTVWGVDDYTTALEELLKNENVENPIMLGHSFGGRVGILFASRNKVRKLILVDAAGVKPRRSLKYYYKVYSYKLVKHLLPMVFGEKRGGELLDKYRGKVGSSDYRQASSKMRAIMSRVVNEDLCCYMPHIKAPTLLIWGENDTATPLRDAKTMQRLIPDSGLVSFPGCGHYSFLDNPRGFSAVLQNFLEEDKTKKQI